MEDDADFETSGTWRDIGRIDTLLLGLLCTPAPCLRRGDMNERDLGAYGVDQDVDCIGWGVDLGLVARAF